MGQVEVTYTNKSKLLEQTKDLTEKVSTIFQMMRTDLETDWGKYEKILENFRDIGVSPVLGKNIESVVKKAIEIEEILANTKVTLNEEEIDISTTQIINIRNTMVETIGYFISLLEDTKSKYRIIEEDTPDGKMKFIMEFKSQTPPQSPDSALEELKKITQVEKVSQAQIPKDLMETQIKSAGDTLELIPDEKSRNHIRNLQSKGKLLNGTLEGLSGGTAFFKVFTIALSQTLNEQSQYYNNAEGGVPVDLVGKLMGGDIEVEKSTFSIKKEIRTSPRILVSYEDLAKKIKGSVRGGKDIEDIKNYIDNLKDKHYLIDMGDHYGGIPYIIKEYTIYAKNTGKELGCILRLSPQYSRTTRGYTSVRADTIQLLGGGNQKDITMNLIDTLLYVRGVNKGVYKVRKETLLQNIATGKRYQKRKGEREVHFKEAIQKAINAKILLGGVDKKRGLKGYREEINPGGEIISIFTFNPNYLKGEEIIIPEEKTK